MESPINEERLLALLLLIARYQKGEVIAQETIYQLYQTHMKQVNNWNLVDASAHWIVGAHLYQRDKTPLLALAKTDFLWKRRIAIVATWYYIRRCDMRLNGSL